MNQPGRKPRPRVLDWLLVLILTGLIVVSLLQATRLYKHLASANEALRSLEGGLASDQLARLLEDPGLLSDQLAALSSLNDDITAVRAILRPVLPLCRHLAWLPYVGPDIAALPALLPMASQTVEAALTVASALEPLVSDTDEPARPFDGYLPQVVQVLSEAEPQLERALQETEGAVQLRAGINRAGLTTRARSLLGEFDRVLPHLTTALKAARALPELLGASTPRTYLILAQNNHELRATGGFVSGVGLVRLHQGHIQDVHFQDSYTVDDLARPHPLPPPALRREMGAGILLLRDANWWPDFPTSAQIIMELFRQDQGTAVDGVLAVDLDTLALLVQALEPIQVSGYAELVDSSNLQSLIMQYWEAPLLAAPEQQSPSWWEHRKDYAGDLLAALLQRATATASPQDTRRLVGALGRALTEKHLLVYVDEPSAALDLLRDLGWDGSLQGESGDYLMVVDSNVGFNKVNPNVEQTADYEVRIAADGRVASELTLTYRHRIARPSPACIHESRYGDTYADLMERCYWDYLRIYLPLGSEVLELSGSDAPAEVYTESDRTVVSTSFLLETGEARQIRLVYSPGFQAGGRSYSLLVQKQPGTDANPFRLTVHLPEGSATMLPEPSSFVGVEDRWVWQGSLLTDLEFQLPWD